MIDVPRDSAPQQYRPAFPPYLDLRGIEVRGEVFGPLAEGSARNVVEIPIGYEEYDRGNRVAKRSARGTASEGLPFGFASHPKAMSKVATGRKQRRGT